MDFVKDFKITKEEDSQVKIEGEIPFAMLEKHRTKAIKNMAKTWKLMVSEKGTCLMQK